MKTKIFIPLVCSAVFATGAMAKCARPSCSSGTCTLLVWDLGNCKFVDNNHTGGCVNNKCQCGTKSYTCESFDIEIGECSSDLDCDIGMVCRNGSCIYEAVVASCQENEYGDGLFCTECPENGKADAGSTSVQDCYLPEGTVLSDSTGTYTYTADCYHD